MVVGGEGVVEGRMCSCVSVVFRCFLHLVVCRSPVARCRMSSSVIVCRCRVVVLLVGSVTCNAAAALAISARWVSG